MAALHDVNEIKVLGLMLLLRLGRLSPASVIPRLDDVAVALKVIMKDLEVKDDTVKQDLERKGGSDVQLSKHPTVQRPKMQTRSMRLFVGEWTIS